MSAQDLTGLVEINALLGRGTVYEGKLAFEGRVRIEGRFRGEIFSEGVLIVGQGADVDAEVDVGTLIVRGGMLAGSVRARQLVEIHAPAKVRAELRTPQLFIDKGVQFDGKCTMEDGETEPDVQPLDDGDGATESRA
jgi:cytoskeletal protein CcmA (bactofilin family)